MAETHEPIERRKFRQSFFRFVVYVLFLSGGIWAAWQVHRAWIAPPDGTKTKEDSVAKARKTNIPGQYLRIEELLRNPASIVATQPFHGNPGGLAFPEGAEQVSAFQWVAADTRYQQAKYHVPGTPKDVAEYYAEQLRLTGGVPRKTILPSGETVLTAGIGSRRWIVVLRTNLPEAMMVTIDITVLDRRKD